MADQNGNSEIISRRDAQAAGLAVYFTGAICPAGHLADRYVSSMACCVCTIQRADARRAAKGVTQPPSPKQFAREQRAAAIAEGKPTYSTGIPCRRGHVGPRFVGNNTCVECDLLRKVGDPAVKTRMKAYYQRTKPERLAWQATYSSANAEAIKAKKKVHRTANKERINAKIAEWATANPDKVRAKRKAREGRDRGADGTYTAADIKRIGNQQKWRCAAPGCAASVRGDHHVDHIKPIVLGGSNWPNNLQLLCPPCNQAKGGKHPIEWAQSLGRLL